MIPFDDSVFEKRPVNNDVTWNNNCADCHGSGRKVLQRAGDPISGFPGFRFSSTLYVPCTCRQ